MKYNEFLATFKYIKLENSDFKKEDWINIINLAEVIEVDKNFDYPRRTHPGALKEYKYFYELS